MSNEQEENKIPKTDDPTPPSQEEERKKQFEKMKDRFGKPPESVINLYYLSRLRVIASLHHITSLKIEKMSVTAEYNKEKAVEHKKWLVGRYSTAKELEGKLVPLLKSL